MSFDYKKVSATAGIFCLGGVILLLVNGIDEETIGKFFKKSDMVQNDTPDQNTQDTPRTFFQTQKEPPLDTNQNPEQSPLPTKPDQTSLSEPDQTPLPTEPDQTSLSEPDQTSLPELEQRPLSEPNQTSLPTELDQTPLPTELDQTPLPTEPNQTSLSELDQRPLSEPDQTSLSELDQTPLPEPDQTSLSKPSQIPGQSGGTRKQYTSVKKTRRCCKYCNKEQD